MKKADPIIQHVVIRHMIVGTVTIIICIGFWFSRLDWDPEMRLWRAVGDAGWMVFWFSLIVGPLARVWTKSKGLVPWRREAGIWFGLIIFLHVFLILNGWILWDVMRFFGYEWIDQFGRYARIEPGFGLANMVGMLAFIWAMILTATSTDWAVNRLGITAWKWLHNGAYIIFYLTVAHVLYFFFIHYTISFHRSIPPNPNWFRYPFIILSLSVPMIQGLAFIKSVGQNSKRLSNQNITVKDAQV